MTDTTIQKEYAFDVKLFATIRVKAGTVDEARALVRKHVDCADANFGAWPDGTPILAEASVDDEELPLIEIDGEPADDEDDRVATPAW